MIAKIFQAITYWPFLIFAKIFFKYQTEGQENLEGLENKPVIFASNHASYIDHPFCGYAIPRTKGSFYPKDFFPLRFLALRQLFSWRNFFPFPISLIAMLYVRINGSLPVEKTKGDLKKALAHVVDEINKKAKIWIYPEGRMTLDGKIGPGKRGVAYLHQETGAPIVPVGLSGTFGLNNPLNLFRRRKIKVKFGEPIYSLGDVSLEGGMEKVMNEIKKLVD
jgi:1-acyl-sn-glycerol-3-phosphate acyltransferase